VHTLVVLGGGRGVTDAMREWSTLGWYNMAAFAVLRARCCSSPPPFKTPTTLTRCKFDERLESVGKAAIGGTNAEAEAAVKEYTDAVHCLARGGTAHLFGQVGYPQGGEATSFKKTFARARALLSK
jgi:serine/threonine-protein kinase